MDANNAAEQTQIETNQAVDIPDSNGATENISAVEAEQSAQGEVNTESSIEVEASNDSDMNTIYQIGDKEYTLGRLSELEKSEMLQSDYTKKSQVNADTRKALDAEKVQISELKSNLDSRIASLDEAIKKGEESVDWDYLREHDISEYTKQKELLAEKKEAANTAKSEAEGVRAAEDAQLLAVEQQMLQEAMPSWADPKQREADVALVEKYVESAGFTEGDFNKLTSHKLMIMAMDAARYQELKGKTANTERSVQKAPSIVKATKKAAPKAKTRAERFYG